MEPYIGQPCNCCRRILNEEAAVIICPACRRPHHVACWIERGGCSTPGCSEQSAEEKQRYQMMQQQREAQLRQAESAKKGSKTGIIIGAVLASIALTAVILVVLLGGGKKKVDFKKIYDQYCKSIWASVGSDGSYLSIDTNPFDIDDEGNAYPAAWEAIKKINSYLGLPASLNEKLGKTSAIDGRQRETYEKQGVNVSWKYHPDNGLEITYSRIE
nr:hypothetical protein [Lachnospiraceae bacterium]